MSASLSQKFEEKLSSIETIVDGLSGVDYICSQQIATSVYLSAHLEKPVIVEGSAGVGKTELALSISRYLDLPLIRMQCYEGLDESKALYEWKYGKQLLYTQILKDKLSDVLDGAEDLESAMDRLHGFGDVFFSEQFLEPRPLLKALGEVDGCVLLIDEIDKSDEQFEAFLLELLSDYQVSIPEIGTIKAKTPPLVFLTSNATRDLGDALKRRCLHLFIPLPDARLEQRVIQARVPGISEALRKQLVAFVQALRTHDLKKLPSISETIDWAKVLLLMHADRLDRELVHSTLNVLLKFEEDIEAVDKQLYELVAQSARDSGLGAIPTGGSD
ncbi:MAG: MoxR-like ATPase [Gammaproteobacteria bacterium]|jgi:MoxR-like ATPase